MFSFIKQLFITLSSFGKFLTTKCVSLWIKHDLTYSYSLIDLNPIVLLNIIHSWLGQISVMEAVMSYLQKYVFRKKTKDKNAKAFNMITKTACDFKYKLNATTWNSNQKRG